MKLNGKNINKFCASYRILPRQKICLRCKNKIFVKNVDSVKNQSQGRETNEERTVTDNLSFEAACSLVNQFLEIFDCSFLKAVRSDRTVALGKRKIQAVTRKFINAVSTSFNESYLAENTDVCDKCVKLVYSIKEKLKESAK